MERNSFHSEMGERALSGVMDGEVLSNEFVDPKHVFKAWSGLLGRGSKVWVRFAWTSLVVRLG